VHGKGHEAYADIGVEAFDGLHQADVAFLHEVVQRQSVTGITAGDMDDKSQLRHDEPTRRVEIFMVAILAGQILLILSTQDGHGVDGADIGIETADRTGQGKFMLI
jgi:hypothetical protein